MPVDPTIQYLTRERPWDPWHAKTNHGLCHDLNPLLRGDFESHDKSWWESLQPGSLEHRALVSSFTTFMGEDYDRLVWEHHRRLNPLYDGKIEAAGVDILAAPRCGCPDFMVDTEPATGSGSWAAGCLGNRDRHEVKFHVDHRRSTVRQWWEQIQDVVLNAYREVGMNLVETQVAGDAHIVVSWEVLGGSVIGLAQLPGSGHCRTGYFCKLDPGYKPSWNQVSQLWAHEVGHNMNSGHISGDPIMHPSMGSRTWNLTFRGTPFGERCNRFFGGEPIPGPVPDPTPPAAGGMSGELVVRSGNTSQTFLVVGVTKVG